ncbi:biotin-dependent carboxyltransferase family protein [Salimicrobium sp. PL1-032A]|uniref:5-oxoprolinase subunit C family protein n=1 Tax=Salimicrobium sp. PL1-032A TaxID=3095364 RepID=UPI00326040F0
MLEIRGTSPLTTIQDAGRVGYQRYGYVVSGAMDLFAFRTANYLVGNEGEEAVIEMTLQGPEIYFEEDAIIAITGGDLSPRIQNEKLPSGKPLYIKKGSVVEWGGCRSGCRAYLAVYGGIEVPEVMGSRSTYLRANIGGMEGRALRKGDRIPVRSLTDAERERFVRVFDKSYGSFSTVRWRVYPSSILRTERERIRIVPGTHQSQFDEGSMEALYKEDFRISPQSDRMGYRLDGRKLVRKEEKELLSEAVTMGTIQVPNSGGPVILMADRQPTGGYPRIAQVIGADLPKLAQKKPGDTVRFEAVTIEEAERLYVERERNMNVLKHTIAHKYA